MAAGRQPLVLRLLRHNIECTKTKWWHGTLYIYIYIYMCVCNVLLVLAETGLKSVPIITIVCSTYHADRPKEMCGTLAEADHWEFRFAELQIAASVFRPSAALYLGLLFTTSTEQTRRLVHSPPIRGIPDLSLGPTFLILIFCWIFRILRRKTRGEYIRQYCNLISMFSVFDRVHRSTPFNLRYWKWH
jgi:hypothetical protein